MLRAVVLTRSKLAKRVNVTFPFTRIFRIYVSFDWPRLLPHARPPTFHPLPPAVPFNLSHQHFFFSFFLRLSSAISFAFAFASSCCANAVKNYLTNSFPHAFHSAHLLWPPTTPPLHSPLWAAWACQSGTKSRYSVAILVSSIGRRHKNANFLIGFFSDHTRRRRRSGRRGRGSWNDCCRIDI